MPTALSQSHFRARFDAGPVDGPPLWIAAEDANFTLGDASATFRIRVTIQETGGVNSASTTFKLQANLNAGAYQDVTTTSTIVKSVDAGASADEAAITTQRLSGTGTFVNGKYDETGATTTGFFINASRNTELEFGVQIVPASVTAGDVVHLKVVTVSGTSVTATLIPAITITAATNTLSQQYAEVINSGNPSSQKIQLNQQYAEVINTGSPASQSVKLSQQYVEVIASYLDRLIAPPLFAADDVIYTPTAAYPWPVTAPLIDSDDDFLGGTVEITSSEANLAADLFDDADALYDPTVAAGEVSVVAGLAVDDDDVPAASVAAGLAPSDVPDDDAIAAPSVSATASIVADLVGDDDAVYTAVIVAKLEASQYSDADVIFDPTAQASNEITPDTYGDSDSVPSPKVDIAIAPSRVVDGDDVLAPAALAENVLRPAAKFQDDDVFPPLVATLYFLTESSLYIDAEYIYGPQVESALSPAWFVEADAFFAASIVGSDVTLAAALYNDADRVYVPSVLKQNKQGSTGGGNPGNVTEQKYATRLFMGASGLITALQVRSTKAQTTNTRMMLYDDASGAPGALLSKSADKAAVISGDNNYPLLTPLSKLQGQPVWVALQSDGTFKWFLAPQMGGSAFNDDAFADGPSDPFGPYTVENQKAPVFVIYLSAATATISPDAVVVDADLFYAPSVRGLEPVAAPAYPSDDAIWPTTVSAVAYLLPQRYAEQDAFGVPVFSWFYLLTASIFDEGDAIYVPFVSPGAGYIGSAAIIETDEIFAVTLEAAGGEVDPPYGDSDDEILPPTLQAEIGITADLFVDLDDIPSPSIAPGEIDLLMPHVIDSDHIVEPMVELGAAPTTFDQTLYAQEFAEADRVFAPRIGPKLPKATQYLLQGIDNGATRLEGTRSHALDLEAIFDLGAVAEASVTINTRLEGISDLESEVEAIMPGE